MIDVDFDYHSKTDDITQSMAQLLLKGWTMLGETCNKCTEVPLMRSKDGTSFCCKCSSSTESKIPDKKQEPVPESDLNVCKIDPYRTFAQVPLNGDELNAIHNENYKIVPGPTQPLDNLSQKRDDFQTSQLRLLEIQLNKSIFRYANLLSLQNDDDKVDIDLDSKIIKNLEGWLGILSTVKKMI